jgi:hypothetical protein
MCDLEGFHFGDITVEEIPIDKDLVARDYMIKMYERIKRLESPTSDNIAEEIVESTKLKFYELNYFCHLRIILV